MPYASASIAQPTAVDEREDERALARAVARGVHDQLANAPAKGPHAAGLVHAAFRKDVDPVAVVQARLRQPHAWLAHAFAPGDGNHLA